MALVEGFGDEVIVALILFGLLTILLLAWMSTGVRDRPLIGVIVVDNQNFQRLLQRISNLTFGPIQITRVADNSSDSSSQPEVTENAESNSEAVEDVSEETAPASDSTTTSTTSTPSCPAVDNFNVESVHRVQSTDAGSSVDDADSLVNLVKSSGSLQECRESKQSETAPSENSTTTTTTAEDTKVLTPTPDSQTLSSQQTETTQSSQERTADSQQSEQTKPASDSQSDSNESNATNNSNAGSSEAPITEESLQDGDLRIRLKYLDDRQKLVRAKPEDTVGDFKKKHFARELAENLIVRFIHNGQELRQDGNTLEAYNVADNSVIHCLLSSRPTQEAPPRQQSFIPEDWDAGYLMFPLFGVILGITWYFRIVYRTYFNAMSTFSLIGITFLFFIALLASIRTQDEDEIFE